MHNIKLIFRQCQWVDNCMSYGWSSGIQFQMLAITNDMGRGSIGMSVLCVSADFNHDQGVLQKHLLPLENECTVHVLHIDFVTYENGVYCATRRPYVCLGNTT